MKMNFRNSCWSLSRGSLRRRKPGWASGTGAGKGIWRAVLLGVVSLSFSSPGRADSLVLDSGNRIDDVTISSAKWDAVAYVLHGAPQSVPGYRVIQLERASAALSPVVAALQAGDFSTAEARLKNPGTRFDWEQAQAAYLLGHLYLEWSSKDPARARDAITAFGEYLKKHGDSKDFFVPQATYELGKAHLAAKQPKTAERQFKELDKFGGSRGIWGYRASIGQGWAILEDRGRRGVVDARRFFSQVQNSSRAPGDVKDEATVGYAASFNVSGEYARAVDIVTRSFIERKKVRYTENYALALNVLGDAHRLQKGKENLQEAELWYLRTTCFFRKYPAVYRTAVKHLVEIYKALGNDSRAQDWETQLN